jgi:DNA-binding beta-propeller fold protein YncE
MIAFDTDGNLVVADALNNRICVIKYVDGECIETIRSFGTIGNNNGQFNRPLGFAFDKSGNIYIADTDNNRVQMLNYANGDHIRTIGSKGNGPENLMDPCAVAVSKDGSELFVHDGAFNGRIQVFSTTDGSYIRSMCTRGNGNGELDGYGCIIVDDDGNIVVSESKNRRIQVFMPNGRFLRIINSVYKLYDPRGIALYKGYIYIADKRIDSVHVFNYKEGTYYGSIGQYPDGAGGVIIKTGSRIGELKMPSGVAIDDKGRIVISDTLNNRIQVFEVSEVPRVSQELKDVKEV